MSRFTPWLVAISMVIIAASLSAVLYTSAGMPLTEAAWIGIGVFLLMIVVQLFATRGKESTGLVSRLDDIGGA